MTAINTAVRCVHLVSGSRLSGEKVVPTAIPPANHRQNDKLAGESGISRRGIEEDMDGTRRERRRELERHDISGPVLLVPLFAL